MIAEQLLAKDCIDVETYVVAREEHKEEGIHFHVYVGLYKKCNVRDAAALDLLNGEQVQHGNYQACRGVAKWIRYCKKDGDYISNAANLALELCKRVKRCRNKTDLYCLFEEDGVPSGKRRLLCDVWGERSGGGGGAPTWPVPALPWMDRAAEWLANERAGVGRPKALFLYGDTCTYKTSWAASLGEDRFHVGVARKGGFTGYSGQEVIIFDEFSDNEWDLSTMKRLITDKAYKTAAYYGVHELAYPRRVIIISNHPNPWTGDPAMDSRLTLVFASL